MRLNFGAVGALAAVGIFAFTTSARAQDTVVVPAQQPAPQPVVVQQPAPTTNTTVVSAPAETGTTYAGPNRALIATGLVTFGISYGTSAIIAGTSNHQGDQHLYVPIAGPWLDLADRGNCGPATNVSCDNETANKVLLVFDGIFQGVGVLSVIGGFLMPEQRVVATTTTAKVEKPKVRVTPASYGRGAPGLAVVGTF